MSEDIKNNELLKQRVEILVADNRIDEAISVLDEFLEKSEDADAYYLRGRLKWKFGKRTDAMSDYGRAAAIDPNSPAVDALRFAHEIMGFYNKDMYNP